MLPFCSDWYLNNLTTPLILFIQDTKGIYYDIKGTLPEELAILKEMRYFQLQWARKDLTGTIPSQLGTSWTKIESFLINDNNLNGSFPFSANSLLGTILMNGNNIEGNVQSLLQLENLKWLEANGNKFSGMLPESMTELEHLSECQTHLGKFIDT